MELKPGQVVQAMVLDTLSGRNPLYRVKDFMAHQDVELLLGEPIAATSFSDTNLARSLDAIFAAGPSKIITALGVRATREFHLDMSSLSYDTTSTNVWGDYRCCEAEQPPQGPVIAHGHSKDHLPQLKQFMTELLCVDRGVPIFGQALDGNSSDKMSNNKILSRISDLMARHGLGPGAFVYVADSAMVTEKNLDAVRNHRFVTRLPATYAECRRAVTDAVTTGTWVDIGSLAEVPTASTRPCAMYKFCEATVELHGKSYRAVVVHSSSHDKRRQKKLDKAIADSAGSITARLDELPTTYFCEADARAAAKQAEQLSGKLHTVSASVAAIEVRKRGRPPKNKPAPTNTRFTLSWQLVEDPAAVEMHRCQAGCFVLLSNIPPDGEDGMDGRKLLQTYKGQYGVESDFAFLKEPLIVNDMFLKTPSRIDALCMILIVALIVWRLMERSMRVYLQNTNSELIGWDNKNTTRPTSFMMTTAVVGIMVALVAGRRVFLRSPAPRPLTYLTAMGLRQTVFLDPSCKCIPVIPRQPPRKG